MNKSLISSVAAAALVGSIGLVYAQTQSTDTAAPQSTLSTPSATVDSTTPSSSSAMPSSSATSTTDDSTLAAQADRN